MTQFFPFPEHSMINQMLSVSRRRRAHALSRQINGGVGRTATGGKMRGRFAAPAARGRHSQGTYGARFTRELASHRGPADRLAGISTGAGSVTIDKLRSYADVTTCLRLGPRYRAASADFPADEHYPRVCSGPLSCSNASRSLSICANNGAIASDHSFGQSLWRNALACSTCCSNTGHTR